MLPLQSVTNWGGAKKLALQSVTKGGVTALSEGYVIYGRSLIQNIAYYLKHLQKLSLCLTGYPPNSYKWPKWTGIPSYSQYSGLNFRIK